MKNKLLSTLLVALISLLTHAQIPTTDLVAQYDLSNGSLVDNINNANFTKTGSLATTITDRFGNANEAMSLNGDELSRPDIDFSTTSNFRHRTISFWLKTSTNDSNEREIYNDNDRNSPTDDFYNGIRVYLKNGKIVASYKDVSFGGVDKTHSRDISDNTWHHIVIQGYSLISTQNRLVLPIYIDGVKEGGTTVASGTLNAYTDGEYTGRMSFSGIHNSTITVPTNNKYQDGIDDILFYKRLLTDAEIATISTNNNYFLKAYVDKTATGNNDGSSWANAYTSLQDALNNTPESTEIWVAKGTYKPHATDVDASFIVSNNIYGGFDGTEASLVDRDLSLIHTTNATILSGDLNDDDTGVAFSINSRIDNSKHVVEVATSDIEINGFTIKDGSAESNSGDDRFGGGIYVGTAITSLTVKKCIIKNNVARTGAGINITSSFSSTFNIDACVFENNLATAASGLDYHMSAAVNKTMDITITNSLFNDNKTLNQAGINGIGASAARLRAYHPGVALNTTIINNTFVNNNSEGTITSDSGNFPVVGLSKFNGSFGTLKVGNNIFWNNTKGTNNAIANAIGKTSDSYIIPNVTTTYTFLNNNTDQSNSLLYVSTANPNLDSNFRLTAASTAEINGGDNNQIPSGITTDLAGNVRVFNTTVDRGAYEFNSSTLSTDNFNVLKNTVSIYPNPATSVLHIEMDQDLKQVTIYSLLGKQVLRTNNKAVDVSTLSNSVYLMKIETENGNVLIKRFVKK